MQAENKDFVAIISDIVDSRKLINRDVVQKRLKKTLAVVNDKYSNNLVANFKISLGDEFQGLLIDQTNIVKIISDIKHMMYPVNLRFGVGIGKITTDIVKQNSLEIDGPAYYQARNMIDKVKDYQTKSSTKNYQILFSNGKSSDKYLLINTCFYLVSTIESDWTLRQKEIIYTFIDYKLNQTKTAKSLGITASTVSRTKQNANINPYLTALNTIDKILQKEDKENVD